MTPLENRLLQVLKKRCFKEGDFKLSSGERSSYYIDGKMAATSSEAARLIGEVLYERTKHLHLDAIGGLEVGAVPITTSIVISYDAHGQTMEGFWVRDKLKPHGTKKPIEGAIQSGWRVAVIDDVFTQGKSALRAVEEVRKVGAEVVAVIALVDRLQGAEKLFAENGITNYQSVFTIEDFGVRINARKPKLAAC
jgi:orotate phosphoribosyltransferase